MRVCPHSCFTAFGTQKLDYLPLSHFHWIAEFDIFRTFGCVWIANQNLVGGNLLYNRMTVIETTIPIVEVQCHNDEQSFTRSCCYCWSSSRIINHVYRFCNWNNDSVPIRALLLCDDSDERSEVSNINTTDIPIQLREVLTVDVYNAFCTKINVWIRQHDIAAAARRSKTKTDEMSFKITLALSIGIATFVLKWGAIVLFGSDDSDGIVENVPVLIIPYILIGVACFVCIFIGVVRIHYYIHNHYIMKYIEMQNKMYGMIERECSLLSKDISTSSVVITLHLGYNHDVGTVSRYDGYCNLITQKYVRTMKFDHIIVTSTTLLTIWPTPPPTNENHSTAITTTDYEGTNITETEVV